MFWDRYVELCNRINKSPNGVCADLGYSGAIATKWKQGAIPRDTTLKKIADYFGTTVSYLKGEDTPTDTITKKDPPVSESEEKLLELFRRVPEKDRAMVVAMIESALAAKRRERYEREELGIESVPKRPPTIYVVENTDRRYIDRHRLREELEQADIVDLGRVKK